MPGVKGEMTEEHKAALAEGRTNGKIVRKYLEALEQTKPRRGRRPAVESLQKQLSQISEKLEGADPLKRLQLTQQRKEIEDRLGSTEESSKLPNLEAAFIGVAASYAASKGIDYATWREAGVAADVLTKAGISR